MLSDGCIVQFEEPYLLLQRESGLFYSMVQQTGKADSEYLSTIAADAYFMRRGIPRSTKEVEMPLSHTVSQEVATKVKSPNKVAVINNIKLDAPIAFAESFHSLLNHASREDDDEEEEVDNTAEERKSIDASEEASTVTSGQNNSAESESDTRNNSSVSDFSQVDDEFMNKGDLVKAGSNDDILENSGIEIPEDDDDTSQCLLPKMESGIGTDVNGSCLDSKDHRDSLSNDVSEAMVETSLPSSKQDLRNMTKTNDGPSEFSDKETAVDTFLKSNRPEGEQIEMFSELEPLIMPGLVDNNSTSVRS